MIKINSATDLSININGTTTVIALLVSICGGFWLLKNRPEAYKDFVNDLPIQDLIVYDVKSFTEFRVLTNKNFDNNAYDKALSSLQQLSDKDQRLSSDKILIYVNKTCMMINKL